MNFAARFFVGALVLGVSLPCVQAADVSIQSRKVGYSGKSNSAWSITVTNNTTKKAKVHYEVRNAVPLPPPQGRFASGNLALKPSATQVVSPVYTKRGAKPEVFWQMKPLDKPSFPALLVDRLVRPGSPRGMAPRPGPGKPKVVRPSEFDGVWEGSLSSVLNGRSQTERIRVEIAGDKVNVTNLRLGGSVQQTVVNRSENSLVLRRSERGSQKTTRMALSVDRKRLFVSYWSESSPGQARGVLNRG